MLATFETISHYIYPAKWEDVHGLYDLQKTFDFVQYPIPNPFEVACEAGINGKTLKSKAGTIIQSAELDCLTSFTLEQ